MSAPYRKRAWNTEPLQWLQRELKTSPLDPATKSHATLWFKQIYARANKDLALQAITKSAVVAYIHTVKLEHELLATNHDTAETERLSRLLILWSAQLARMLRLSGMWAKAPKGKGKELFTPTRDEKSGPRTRPDRGNPLEREAIGQGEEDANAA